VQSYKQYLWLFAQSVRETAALLIVNVLLFCMLCMFILNCIALHMQVVDYLNAVATAACSCALCSSLLHQHYCMVLLSWSLPCNDVQVVDDLDAVATAACCCALCSAHPNMFNGLAYKHIVVL
jgi:hypothetical protein